MNDALNRLRQNTRYKIVLLMSILLVSSLGGNILSVQAALIKGTQGNDNLSGTPKDDNMEGLRGNDNLNGLLGNDIIQGDQGKDILNGGDGNALQLITCSKCNHKWKELWMHGKGLNQPNKSTRFR